MANRFVVDLGSIKLSKAQTQGIQLGIQQVVLNHLAALDNRGDLFCRFPIRWPGFICDRRHDDLLKRENDLRQFAGRGG